MSRVAEKPETVATAPTKTVLLAAGVLGFSYATTQLVLMRELLAAFSGNEMVLGFVLGGWLLLMGIGTLAGRFADKLKHPLAWLSVTQVVLALVPPLQVFLLRWLRNIVFTRGADVEPAQTLCAVLVLLLPYCIPGGLALALASASLLTSEGARAVGRVYTLDGIGSVAGGLLFSLLLVHFLDHISLLLVPAVANLLMAGIIAFYCQRAGMVYASMTLTVALPLIGFASHPDKLATRLQYPGQQILERANSEYGNLVLLKSDGQIAVLQNNLPIAANRDNFHSEETVHYAMAQRPDARRVLLAGGYLSGSPDEVLKYASVEQLDCVELDPVLLRLSTRFAPGNLRDSRIRPVSADLRSYLSQGTGNRPYDVILLDLPLPSTVALNRFFTAEFFSQARRFLARDGVLAFSLGDYGNYVSPERARVLACARATIAAVFSNVKLVPGGRVFFLASNGPLSEDIVSLLESNAIPTRLLKRSYLESQLAPDRFRDLARAAALPAEVNRDFSPTLYYLHLRHWLSQFESRLSVAWGAVALSLLAYSAYLLWRRPTAAVLFSAGFAGTTLQLVLLLSYQILCGSVYYQLGIIISMFMAGLVLGAWMANRDVVPGAKWFPKESVLVVLLAALVVVFALVLPYCVRLLGTWSNSHPGVPASQFVIASLAFTLAALLGGQFTAANRVEFDTTAAPASRLYTADFLGSFTGAIITCTALIPLLGVAVTCYLTAALNLITALVFGLRVRSA